jgi:hypothetical protein
MKLQIAYHKTQIAPANAAIAICLLVIAIVAQVPKMKQFPIRKMIICFFPCPADLKLKNGISLTSK